MLARATGPALVSALLASILVASSATAAPAPYDRDEHSSYADPASGSARASASADRTTGELAASASASQGKSQVRFIQGDPWSYGWGHVYRTVPISASGRYEVRVAFADARGALSTSSPETIKYFDGAWGLQGGGFHARFACGSCEDSYEDDGTGFASESYAFPATPTDLVLARTISVPPGATGTIEIDAFVVATVAVRGPASFAEASVAGTVEDITVEAGG